MGCKNQHLFPSDGYGDLPGYFHQSWDGTHSCIPVSWQTGWSIYARGDYKRCVCDFYGGEEEGCSDSDESEVNDDSDGEISDDSDGEDSDDSDGEVSDDSDGEVSDNDEETPIV
jgi:hypothetical protein